MFLINLDYKLAHFFQKKIRKEIRYNLQFKAIQRKMEVDKNTSNTITMKNEIKIDVCYGLQNNLDVEINQLFYRKYSVLVLNSLSMSTNKVKIILLDIKGVFISNIRENIYQWFTV